jgi:hypothetical protein
MKNLLLKIKWWCEKGEQSKMNRELNSAKRKTK